MTDFTIKLTTIKSVKGKPDSGGCIARIVLKDGTYCALKRFRTKKEAREWADSQLEDPRFTAKWAGKDEQGS